jgi:thiazole synthase
MTGMTDMPSNDLLRLPGADPVPRLLLGTSGYPSPDALARSVRASGSGVVTVSVRRESAGERAGQAFWSLIAELGVRVLPNTAGCRDVRSAVTTAEMAREIFETDWIKLEIVGDEETQHPDPFGLVEAAGNLVKRGFTVFPYMTDDLVLAERLVDAGCTILMPWASPIGSGRGIANPAALRRLRERFRTQTLIVDAGLGLPSHAAQAMEFGFDAVLVNSAVAGADDPPAMAAAFAHAVEAGRLGWQAGPMPQRDTSVPSTPLVGMPFWQSATAS